MKTLVLIFTFLVSSTIIQAQDNTQKKLTRQERKAIRIEKALEKKAEIANMLRDTSFVIQAVYFELDGNFYSRQSYWANSGSNTIMPELVDPDSYFIKVKNNKVIVQTGVVNQSNLNSRYLMERTMTGSISEMKIKRLKNFTKLSFSFNTSLGFYHLIGEISDNGSTTCMIYNLTTNGKVSYKGELIDPCESNIYVNWPVF